MMTASASFSQHFSRSNPSARTGALPELIAFMMLSRKIHAPKPAATRGLFYRTSLLADDRETLLNVVRVFDFVDHRDRVIGIADDALALRVDEVLFAA